MRYVDHDPHRTALLDDAVRRVTRGVRDQAWLDAGCGEGRAARELAARGARVLGVDVAPGLVAAARRRARTLPPAERRRLHFETGDLAATGLLDPGVLDGVLCLLALMHVPRERPVLAAWARALKPGGRLVLVLPHPCFMGPDTTWGATLPQVPRGAPTLDHLRVASYPGRGRQEFRFSPAFPASTVNHHRSLATLTAGLAAHGFLTRRLLEPRPTGPAPHAAGAADPAWEARRRIPFFLVWEAIRTPGAPL